LPTFGEHKGEQDRKEVNNLKTYTVRVCIPTIYAIEAENSQEAKRKAGERYKKEFNLTTTFEY
jgi:hypothetical protein